MISHWPIHCETHGISGQSKTEVVCVGYLITGKTVPTCPRKVEIPYFGSDERVGMYYISRSY